MNFEFLRGLKGLNDLYKPCKDAEELAISKPYMSMFASRKSAELLAKFIYIAAYYSAVEGMTFADILSDAKVQEFINNRGVLRAFHHIRKKGNAAVHDNNIDVGKDNAIDLLEELHYIAGETAIRLHLIESYPVFDSKIEEYPSATFSDDMQINQKAQEMFLDYIEKHEYREYSKHFVELDAKNSAHRDYLVHGKVVMHEYLEFKEKPNYRSTVEYLQQYLIFLDEMASERSPVGSDYSPEDFQVSITICIDGSIVYDSDCCGCIENDIFDRLAAAQSFSFDCHLDGNLVAIHDLPGSNCEKDAINEDELWQGRGLSDFLESIKRREQFNYKMILYYPDDNNNVVVDCIRDGKTLDIPLICKTDFSRKLMNHKWLGDMLSMHINFNHQAHPEILEKLHDTVTKLLSKDELSCLDEFWGDDGEDPCWLLLGNTIVSKDLSEIEAFIERFNTIIEPVAHECTIYFNDQFHQTELLNKDPDTFPPKLADYVKSLKEASSIIDPSIPDLSHCFYCMKEFAVAAFIWKNHKLQLVGTVL